MNPFSLEQLQQFIANNNISRVDGMLLFKGTVHFSKDNNDHTINSDIQIIMLAGSAAVYILEFLKEGYSQNEMYSTSDYLFKCTADKTLQISNDKTAITVRVLLSPEV